IEKSSPPRLPSLTSSPTDEVAVATYFLYAHRRNSGKPLALSGEKYARRRVARDVRRLRRSLRRPPFCFHQFGQSRRISLFHRTRATPNATIPAAVPKPRKSNTAYQPNGGLQPPAGRKASLRQPGRPAGRRRNPSRNTGM